MIAAVAYASTISMTFEYRILPSSFPLEKEGSMLTVELEAERPFYHRIHL